jgi:hypothetical protein
MPLLTLSRADYPGIDPAEIGTVARRGYGSVEDVRIPAIVAGQTARLAAVMSAAATSITVDDGSVFPAAPFAIQIGGEPMTVGAISGNTLSSITRAADAEPHPAGRTVYEVRSEYVYLVSDQPVDAIGAVFVDGVRQEPGTYTAYTGQAGDAHADWTGQAVVAFAVDPAAIRQRNLSSAGTEDVVTPPDLCTDDGHGTDIALLGGTLAKTLTTGESYWVAWTGAGAGTIVEDSVVVSFTNPGAVAARLRVSSRNITTGATIKTEMVYLAAGASSRLHTLDLGNVWPVQLTVFCETGTATINTITRTTTRVQQPASETLITYTHLPVVKSDERIGAIEGTEGVPLGTAGQNIAWATFDSTDLGTIVEMSAYGSIYSNYGATVWLLGLNGTTLVSREKIIVPVDGTGGIRLGTIPGGTWATHLAIVVESGDANLEYIERRVSVLADNANDSGGKSTARVAIGERVCVSAAWHYDPDGEYGGAGNLIERPDWVIKHFLVNYLGATLAEIDDTSFAAAGTLHAAAISGGYKLGFIVPQQSNHDTLKTIGFCSRSTTRFLGGKYYHHYTPDAAPTAVRTLTRDDLAGEGSRYVYAKDSMRSVFNDLTALFSPNYSGNSAREVSSGYLASAAATSAASVAKYGTYATTYNLPCVRSATMAAHVLAHLLLEVATPLLTVTFSTFWQHGDLQVGQTITITDDIYTGRSWWIERLQRPNKFTCAFTAREWWT